MAAVNWCWTWNNYPLNYKSCVENWYEMDLVNYLICGEEIGESGTPHLQGFLQITKKRRMRALKRLLGIPELHLEKMKGTLDEAISYCQKEGGEVLELGNLRRKGKRTDLEAIQESLKNGATELEIAEQYFSQWIRYGKRFKEYQDLLNPRSSSPRFTLESFSTEWIEKVKDYDYSKCMVLVGETGIGKTEFALALLPGALVVSHMDDLIHFKDQSGIIFDDMSFDHMPRSAQIHITDWSLDRSIHIRYQTAFIPANTKKIFTTNVKSLFENDPAINRRINFIEL
jgi:hypothetical protein